MAEISDIVLLNRLKKGDYSAFDEIYLRHKGPSVLLARHILCSSIDVAEDVVQDIFLQWWSCGTLAKLAERENVNLEAFIKKSVKNGCAKYYHKRKSQLNREQAYYVFEQPGEEVVHDISDMDDRVQKFLDNLKPMPKNSLTLHYLEGYEIKEIAAQWGVSSQVIRHYLHRGLKKIRERLKIK